MKACGHACVEAQCPSEFFRFDFFLFGFSFFIWSHLDARGRGVTPLFFVRWSSPFCVGFRVPFFGFRVSGRVFCEGACRASGFGFRMRAGAPSIPVSRFGFRGSGFEDRP